MLLTILSCLVAAPGADDGPASYSRDVRPILAEHCLACHGPDAAKREADLRLDTEAGLTADLGGYAPVVPGDPGESELFLRVTAEDEGLRMPPADTGAPLTGAEIAVLARWIEEGAVFESHWAYAPFRRVEPPHVADASWPRNAIDRFVLAKLEREGLRPSAEADRRTLARRASLDLVGMVPSPEAVEAFVDDERDDAYERYVDALLASPHYGERWARHWLDLARYADSHGFTIDSARSMWPYRDWVVGALNADMPFDRFTIEQLAGDLLPEPSNAQLVATGFHRNTQVNQEGGAKDEENRVLAVIDRVDTTASVWLGSTLGCARCHDHKYDPFEQREYYRLFAFFDQTEDGGVSAEPRMHVASDEELARLDAYEDELARTQAELERVESKLHADATAWQPDIARGENGPELRPLSDGSYVSLGQNPVTSVYTLEGVIPRRAKSIALEVLPDRSLRAGGPGRAGNGNFVLERVRLFVERDGTWEECRFDSAIASFEQSGEEGASSAWPVEGVLSDEPHTGWAIKPRFGEPNVALFRLAEEVASGSRVRLELYQNYGSNHVLGRFRVLVTEAHELPADLDEWSQAWGALLAVEKREPDLPTTLVMRTREKPRTTHVFRRGNPLDPTDVVEPGFPAALDVFPHEIEPRDRLDLARWLVHPENALVHRVTVNRWWQRFFGLGLVETENDFGLRGDEPSHPDLLEWLARELVRTGYSQKAIHRLIVTSATYRQSSRPRADLAEVDARNRLLAHQARLRVDAECIRDSALAASGLLAPRLGGPPVQPPQPEGVFAFTQSHRTWKPSEGEDRYRRSLYTRIWRSATYPFFTTFDAPVPNVTCTRRLPSNTALQALALANDPMILELAAGLGQRAAAEGATDEERIARAFELCLSRPPDAAETALLARHLALARERGDDEEQAWASLGRVLFNLDEFVTRE